jgi:hypothetical protein
MGVQTSGYKLTPQQWSALQAEIQEKFDFDVAGDTGTSPEVHGTTLSWSYDGEENLVVSADGPWPFPGIAIKDIAGLVAAVTG